MKDLIIAQEVESKDDAKHPTGEMHETPERYHSVGMTADGSMRVEIATGTLTTVE